MSESVINRPEVDFEAVEHVYTMNGERVLGVSTVAKIGGADDAWGIASAWGWRVGIEGARKVLLSNGALLHRPVPADYKQDPIRLAMQAAKFTPWDTRDKASERGSWVHDLLEELGQDHAVPDMRAFAEKHGDEAAGHGQSVLAWFLAMRPEFVALEVQVASRTHLFAGRYDVRALIDAARILPSIDPLREDDQARRVRDLARRGLKALCLVDLKTSKGIYPTSHMPQLEGYEGAGVEMGYPATDCRAVLNTWATGDFEIARDFAVSWSEYPDFLGYLQALRAIRRIKAGDPEAIREKRLETALLASLPAYSRDLVGADVPEFTGLDAKAIGRGFGKLKKRGLVKQEKGKWSLCHPTSTQG